MGHSAGKWRNGICVRKLTDAASDEEFVAAFVDCYISVFNSDGDGEWNESWSREQVREKIFGVAPEVAEKTRVVTASLDAVLTGFSVVHVDVMDKALGLQDLPPHLQTQELLTEVKRHLVWLAGEDPVVCNFKEVGIRKEHRQGPSAVMKLFSDAYASSLELGAEFACWWTSRNSRMYYLAMSLDGRLVYDCGDKEGHLMMGEEVKHALRRITTPGKELVRMLGERLKHHGIHNPYRPS